MRPTPLAVNTIEASAERFSSGSRICVSTNAAVRFTCSTRHQVGNVVVFDRCQLSQQARVVQQAIQALVARLDGGEQGVVVARQRIFQIELHDRGALGAVLRS